jgi:glycerophosphoryl diester phosphodiesterase
MMEILPSVIAHRGGRDWAPENTIAAFRKSVEAGVDGVEFDVHRCASGELVVIHDDDLSRTTNGVGLVRDASLAELKRLSAGLWFSEEFRNERVPCLSEVLDLFGEKTMMNIEVKNAPVGYDGIEEDLLAELEPYRSKLNIVVSSFDHYCLRRLHELDSRLAIGVLVAGSLVDPGEYCSKFAAAYYIQNLNCLLPGAVRVAQAAGLKLIVWTANDKVNWQRLIDMGVNGICTDLPASLQAYYRQSYPPANASG